MLFTKNICMEFYSHRISWRTRLVMVLKGLTECLAKFTVCTHSCYQLLLTQKSFSETTWSTIKKAICCKTTPSVCCTTTNTSSCCQCCSRSRYVEAIPLLNFPRQYKDGKEKCSIDIIGWKHFWLKGQELFRWLCLSEVLVCSDRIFVGLGFL